jgi:hypothetical protein
MRHSIAGRGTSVTWSGVRAAFSLFAIAATGGKLREVGVTNTTVTALAVALARFTNATGVGAALTEADYDPAQPAACTGFAGHTADGAVGQIFRQATIAAAVGAGVVWTFGDSGILIPVGTGNGIGLIVPTGAGQVLDYWMDWDE